MMAHLLSLMARLELQPVWRFLYKVAIGGLGYMNPEPRLNGEDRYLAEWAAALAARGRRTPVVIDVGANEGDFAASVLALLPGAEVHCFEPHPATSARLQSRFREDARVQVHAMGLGDRRGTLPLHDYEGGGGGRRTRPS